MSLSTLKQTRCNTTIILLGLGFSSGLPLALVGSTLQAWYTVSGMSLLGLGFLSALGQPYVMKFLWAPMLDRYMPLRQWVGDGRRGWVVIMQLALCLLLLFMGCFDPSQVPYFVAGVAWVVACCSATQDMALDAYRTEFLPEQLRGWGSACHIGGYRLAMLVSGGVAMVLADHWGWPFVYRFMGVLMLCALVVTLCAPQLKHHGTCGPESLREAIGLPIRRFMARPAAGRFLALIALYKLTDALTLSLSTPFLIRTLHFTLTDVGSIYKVVGMGATVLGCLIAGMVMRRWSRYRALWVFGVLQGCAALLFVLLACVGKHYGVMVGAIFGESLFSGMGSVALLAVCMDLCEAGFSGTQFALFSALASLGRLFGGPIAALLVHSLGWTGFFGVAAGAALPSLWVLYSLKHQMPSIMAKQP